MDCPLAARKRQMRDEVMFPINDPRFSQEAVPPRLSLNNPSQAKTGQASPWRNRQCGIENSGCSAGPTRSLSEYSRVLSHARGVSLGFGLRGKTQLSARTIPHKSPRRGCGDAKALRTFNPDAGDRFPLFGAQLPGHPPPREDHPRDVGHLGHYDKRSATVSHRLHGPETVL